MIVLFYSDETQTVELPFDTIVCFGDSNLDTGNVYNLTHFKWPIVPPYYQGRFSNGPIWIEKLGISNLINYAHGSATTDNMLITGVTGSNTIVPGVRQQIATYTNTTDLHKINFDRTIYIIWAGVNNYFFNMYLLPSTVVNSLINGINDLIQIGGKHFLIVNQPFLQIDITAMFLNMTNYANTLIRAHNGNLSNSIQLLQSKYPNISFHLYDVHSLITKIINNTSTYGINSTKNCWSISSGTLNVLCTTPDTYILIDEYHFTTRIHEFIADNARQLFATSNGTLKSFYSIVCVLAIFILIF